MAIGGVSSATIRFRRPRGLKGPVADSFHKISQLDVKARELNRTLGMIDSGVNIISNIYQKLRVGVASEGQAGYGGGLFRGILGDLGLYGPGGFYDTRRAEYDPRFSGSIEYGTGLKGFFRNINRDGFFAEDGMFQQIGHTFQQMQKGWEMFKLPPDLVKANLLNEYKDIAKQVYKTAEGVERLRHGMGSGVSTNLADQIRMISLNMGNAVKAADQLTKRFVEVPPTFAGKRAKLVTLAKPTRELGVAQSELEKTLVKLRSLREMPEAEAVLGHQAIQLLDPIGANLTDKLNQLKELRKTINQIRSDQHEHIVDGEKVWRTGIEWASDAQVSEVWESFNKIDAQKISTSLKEARAQLDKFEEIARKKGAKVSDHLGKAAEGAGQFTQNINESKSSVEDLSKTSLPNFDKMERSIERMSKASEKFSIEVKKLNNRTGTPDKKVVEEFGKSLGGGGFLNISPIASLNSLYAMAAPYLVTQNVIDFSKQMGTIRAETLGTDINQAKLRDSILSVAGSSRFTAGDVANAVVGAVRSGFQITTELKGIQHLATLAVAENVDLQTAYSSIEPILNTLNIELRQLPRVADKLSAATSTGATNLRELGWIAGKSLSSHLETGGSFDEFFAIASILRSSGKGRELTSTLLKNLQLSYSMMASGQGTKTQKTALQEIGITTDQFYNEKGHLKGTIDITKVITQAIKESGLNTAEVIVKLFGKESGPTGIPLYSESGLIKLAEAIESISESKGTAKVKRRTQEQSIYNQFQNIKSAAEEITIRLFGGDEKHFANLLSHIAGKLKQFANFLKQNAHHINAFFDFLSKWFTDNNEKIISFFRVVGKSLLDVGKFFGKIVGFLTTFVLNFQGIFASFLKFFLYFKIFKFFFGGIFSFILGGFAKTIIILRTIGLTVATWTLYLGPLLTKLFTTNKLLRSISAQVFGMVNAKNIKDVWANLAPTKIFDRDVVKEGLKTTGNLIKDTITTTFSKSFEIASKITKKGFEVTGGILKKVGSRFGEILFAPFRLGLEIIGSTGIFTTIAEQFGLIRNVAVTTFQEAKLFGLSNFAAIRDSVKETAIYIGSSMRLAFLGMKADALRSFAAIKAGAISTGVTIKTAFLHPIVTSKKMWVFLSTLSFAKIATGLTSVFSALKGIAIIGPIITAISSSLATIGSILSAPFVAIGLAVAGIATLMIRNWEKVKQYFLSVWNFLKALFGFIITVITFIFHQLNKKFPIIGKIFIGIGMGIKGIFVGVWDTLKAIGKWIEDTFVKTLSWITDKVDKMTGWLRKFTHLMKTEMAVDKAVQQSKIQTETKIEKTEKEVDKKIKETEKETKKDIFQRKEITSTDAASATAGTFSRSSGPSIEFISFKRMNDLTVTIESGFQQLLNVNSKILDVLSGGDGKILLNEKEKTATILGSTNNSSISKSFSHVTDRGDKGLVATLPSPMNPASVKLPSEQSIKLPNAQTIDVPSEQSIELPNSQTIDVPSIKVETPGSQNNLSSGEDNGVIVQNTFNIQATPDMDIDELAKAISEYIEKSQKLNQFGKG